MLVSTTVYNAIVPFRTKNPHQTIVTFRVYKTPAFGKFGVLIRANCSITEGGRNKDTKNTANMRAFTHTG